MAVFHQLSWIYPTAAAPSGTLTMAIYVLIGALAGSVAVYGQVRRNFNRRSREAERLQEIVQQLLETPETSGHLWVVTILDRLDMVEG
jgi:uncharacterized membrane protein YdjX (TVP38/TMEM64 family)